MRILIQNSRNQLWFRSMEVWTADVSDAFDFQHSQKALDFIKKHQLHCVQLVIKFPDPSADVTVRLPHTELELACA